MNKVIIKKISLTNFKGFAKADRLFDPLKEEISAENGQGKTTLRDAWFWLLGFNVNDIIPCRDNKEIPNLEICVEAEISIVNEFGESAYILKKEQKEVRKTNKDTGVEEKVSNESTYAIDGTPFTLRNYKEKLAALFGVPYDKLQMLCQKEFFNTDNGEKWKWSNRRKELFELCEVDALLADMVNKPCYNLIAPDIRKKYSTTEIKKAIKKELSGYAAEKDKNAVLIADKQAEMAKYGSYNFSALEAEKSDLETKITEASLASAKATQSEEIARLQKERAEVNAQIYRIQGDDAAARGDLQRKINTVIAELTNTQKRAEGLKQDMSAAQSAIEGLEAESEKLTTEEWKGETVCPTCLQPLPAERIEESKKRYETTKAERLAAIAEEIDNRLVFLTTAKQQLEDYRTAFSALRSQRDAYEKELAGVDSSAKIAPLTDRLAEIAAAIDYYTRQDSEKNDVSAVVEPMKRRVAEINSLLGYKRILADFADRVEQLKKANLDLTDREMLAKTKVRQLDEYVKEQVQLVSDAINSRFSNGVSFSLFTELYAGSEHDIKEECVCVLNGKTYNEMSYGERFFADLEVAKALQEQYKISLPIFLDNAECFTGDIAAEQQVICLYAKKGQYMDGVKIEVIL